MKLLGLLLSVAFVVADPTLNLLTAKRSLSNVLERQIPQFCSPVPAGPNLCERACGPGNIACLSDVTCYNPSAGEVCCSDGTYCPDGYYCTDNSCCPDGTPLEQCGATQTLSIIPPPQGSATTVTSQSSITSSSTATISQNYTSTTATTSPSSPPIAVGAAPKLQGSLNNLLLSFLGVAAFF